MIGLPFDFLPPVNDIDAANDQDKGHNPEKILLHKRLLTPPRRYLIDAECLIII